MFVDHDNQALNIKIVIFARDVARAPAALRAWAAVLPASCNGELLEPEPGGIRLLSLDYFLPALGDGYSPHPHLYAIDATSDQPLSEYEDMSLHHGADAVIDLDAQVGAFADAVAAALAPFTV